jgi:hypothetical protein
MLQKLIPFLFLLLSIGCRNKESFKREKDEHIVIEIDENTDSVYRVFKPTIQNVQSSRVSMKGYWNDTILSMNSPLPKDTVDNGGIDVYHPSMPVMWWSFKKYKATKYHIRFEVIFSQERSTYLGVD